MLLLLSVMSSRVRCHLCHPAVLCVCCVSFLPFSLSIHRSSGPGPPCCAPGGRGTCLPSLLPMQSPNPVVHWRQPFVGVCSQPSLPQPSQRVISSCPELGLGCFPSVRFQNALRETTHLLARMVILPFQAVNGI